MIVKIEKSLEISLIKQINAWLKENSTISDCEGRSEQIDYAHREFDRCSTNTLYAANKYYFLK
jgi:hypothetical protein